MQSDAGNLWFTLSTFLFLVRRSGRPVADAQIEAACAAVEAGQGSVHALGQRLVDAVRARIQHNDYEGVMVAVQELVGADRVRPAPAADTREERIVAVRRALFGRSLPWLAVIIDRFPDGSVGRHWVMVEQFTDVVQVMDPYPWDDRDEERTLPITDFMVQWELAGCQGMLIG